MKKALSVLLIVAMLLSSLVLMVSADETPTATVTKNAPIAQAIKGTPVIDGTVDEIWQKAQVQYIAQVANKSANYVAGKTAVANATFRTMWDENYFYVLWDVNDPTVGTKEWNNKMTGGNIINRDTVMASINPNADEMAHGGRGSKSQTFNMGLNIYADAVSKSGTANWNNVANGVFLFETTGEGESAVNTPNFVVSFKKDAAEKITGYYLEIKYNLTLLNPELQMKAGSMIGMQTYVCDNFGENYVEEGVEGTKTSNTRDYQLAWTDLNGWGINKNMGTVEFVEEFRPVADSLAYNLKGQNHDFVGPATTKAPVSDGVVSEGEYSAKIHVDPKTTNGVNISGISEANQANMPGYIDLNFAYDDEKIYVAAVVQEDTFVKKGDPYSRLVLNLGFTMDGSCVSALNRLEMTLGVNDNDSTFGGNSVFFYNPANTKELTIYNSLDFSGTGKKWVMTSVMPEAGRKFVRAKDAEDKDITVYEFYILKSVIKTEFRLDKLPDTAYIWFEQHSVVDGKDIGAVRYEQVLSAETKRELLPQYGIASSFVGHTITFGTEFGLPLQEGVVIDSNYVPPVIVEPEIEIDTKRPVAYAAKGTPTIDGQIDDVWATTKIYTYDAIGIQPSPTYDGKYEPASGSFRTLWDENYLYFLFVVKDATMGSASWDETSGLGGNLWKRDGVMLSFGLDYDREATGGASGSPNIQMIISSFGNTANYQNAPIFDEKDGETTKKTYSIGYVMNEDEDPVAYILEFKLNIKAVYDAFKMQDGSFLSFYTLINDNYFPDDNERSCQLLWFDPKLGEEKPEFTEAWNNRGGQGTIVLSNTVKDPDALAYNLEELQGSGSGESDESSEETSDEGTPITNVEVPTTAPVTTEATPATDAPATTEAGKPASGGCKSIISGSALALATVLSLGVAFVGKKRK